MTSAIVKGPHQHLFLSEWDILWYTWKKYEHRESFHNIDTQGIKIHDFIFYFIKITIAMSKL